MQCYLLFFVILAPAAIWLILHLMSRQKENTDGGAPQKPIEVCALCHEEFPMNQLLEKEVGGYGRVYCFCGQCIESLYHEYREYNRHQNWRMKYV